jgi:Zn-dependent protease with chaperone function
MDDFNGVYQRVAGKIKVTADGIEFIGEQSLPISRHQLSFKVYDLNNIQIVFFDKNDDQRSITCYDTTIVDALRKHGIRLADPLARSIRIIKSKRKLKYLIPILGLLTLFFALPFSFKWMPHHWYSRWVSHHQIRVLGEAVLPKNLDQTSIEYQSIKGMADDIIRANPGLVEIPFEFYLAPSPQVNAYAAPGGLIVINRGLLLSAENASEMYGVLAHEMAHTYLRHDLKALVSQVAPLLGVGLLEFLLGGSANILIPFVRLSGLQHSKDSENAADRQALLFLKNAKINGAGLISFFEKLKRDPKYEILSTHPSSSTRIQKTKDFLDQNQYEYDQTMGQHLFKRLKSD